MSPFLSSSPRRNRNRVIARERGSAHVGLVLIILLILTGIWLSSRIKKPESVDRVISKSRTESYWGGNHRVDTNTSGVEFSTGQNSPEERTRRYYPDHHGGLR